MSLFRVPPANKTPTIGVGHESHVKRQVMRFGRSLKRLDLAEVVVHLYDAALQESSRRTYRTGQRAYIRFLEELSSEGHRYLEPFQRQSLNKTELSLAFFMTYLVLQPTITAASTILGYEGHVKYKFRENGREPSAYKTPILGQIRHGIQNVFPCQNDKR